LFYERLGRAQIGKTPPKIDLSFCDNSQSMAHLNFAQSVKVHYPAAHFEVQFIIGDDKLDDVGIFTLVCDGPAGGWLAHNSPPDDQDNAMRLLADKHQQIIRASSRAEQLGCAVSIPCSK